MVQVPSTNTVRESRHVAVYGLPHTLPDDTLQSFFARFGPIQRLFRQQDNQDVVFVSFMDSRSASLACKTETQFDKDISYRITFYNPESIPKSPVPEFPTESVACVVYEIQSGSTPEREVFELVKKHSKRSGIPIDIQLETTIEPGWKKARVHYYKLDSDKLKADKNLILGRAPKFRVYYPPNSSEQLAKHPPCTPSTSYAIPKLKGDHLLRSSCSVHVPHLDRHAPDHYRRRFESYGQIIDVDMVKSNENKAFAVVQFTNIDDAQKALTDSNIPKPMSYTSRQSHRLILFYLPQEYTDDEIMLRIRGLSEKIVDIIVDWHDRSAVVSFDDVESANVLLKRMRQLGRNNFGDHKVAVDFCSDRFNTHFIKRKIENIERAAKLGSSLFPSKSERFRNTNSPASSSSRGNPGTRSLVQPRSSAEQQHTQDEENEASSSDSSSGSDSDGSDSSSEESDDDNDDDVDVERKPVIFDEPEETSQSPSNEQHDDSNDVREQEYTSEPYFQPSTSSHQESSEKIADEYLKEAYSPYFSSQSPSYMEDQKQEIKKECSPTTSIPYYPELKVGIDLPASNLTKMLNRMKWRDCVDMFPISNQIDRIVELNHKARAKFEKLTGRPFPKFTNEDDLKMKKFVVLETRDYFFDNSCNEMEIRIREWRKLVETMEFDDFRAADSKELIKEAPPQLAGRSSGRPSLDESRSTRLSFDATHHPAELAQRSHSLCVGPMTPATPYPMSQPLLVNTSHPLGMSQPSCSGVTTPRSAQIPQMMSPVSRHNSMSSTGRPANIQTPRHHSVMFPPDVSIPPPPIPPTHDEMMIPKETPSSRRSSETISVLKSPPFSNQIQNLMTMPLVPPPHLAAATGTHSVSSSAHSTPRHSISGTPVHSEPSSSKNAQPLTPKTNKPDKVSVRHDSMSKPVTSNAMNALQGRSQSMTVSDFKKSASSTPVVRDAGSDLIAQIMSNQPSMGFKKLPRIEKKPSALQNLQNLTGAPAITAPTSAAVPTSHQVMLLKDKEKEKKRKEREHEREREARKEMKRKETKEERHRRKDIERTKREKEERREQKRVKKVKEKEERRKEKEKEKRKAAGKEKHKKKKNRKEEDSDDSESTSNDELVLDTKKSTKEMTQEEKDHQLALILSKGSIIENLKSRRRSDKRQESFDKLRQKNQNAGPRRVLIESSDDDEGGDDDEDDEKEKSDSSSGEASETDQRFLPPPPMPPALSPSETKEKKHKLQKEREKGELTSSSDEEDEHVAEEQRKNVDQENRKRQKSLASYSSDEHGERKNAAKKSRREDSDEATGNSTWVSKEVQKSRKRKLMHRRSSPDEFMHNAKRDFRDIPHEDVSDEEDTEDVSRDRRQSTSSSTSNTATHGKKEKGGKTPLNITTPAGTPLQSPKILSPKLASPKVSGLSSKRPSISDQESLISPLPRNRTSSSTSTATNTSKHETTSTEKPLLSPVTAKTSLSSVDDLTLRDEFGVNSVTNSPSSTAGRPMVLTKAAMKAFNSSPAKKQSSSSGLIDSSSGSTSNSSSSGDSSTSSEDSSDEETYKRNANSPISEALVQSHSKSSNQDNPVINSQAPAAPTVSRPPPSSEEVITGQKPESEPELVTQTQLPSLSRKSSAPELFERENEITSSHKVENSTDLAEAGSHVIKISEKEHLKEDQKANEDESSSQIIDKPKEGENTLDSMPQLSAAPSATQFETSQSEPQSSTHTLISDQETDQAVQSIFDEEEADEFPQYPDFVMKEEKNCSQKESAAHEPMKSSIPDTSHSIDDVNVEHTDKPASSTSTSPDSAKQSEQSVELEETEENETDAIFLEKEVSENPINVPGSSSETTQIDVIESNDPEREPSILDDSSQQTPAPELISADCVQKDVIQHDLIDKEFVNDLQQNPQSVQAPVLPQNPLEIIVSQYSSQLLHQVVQPSPLPAVAVDSKQTDDKPLIQQSRPSPIGETSQYSGKLPDELRTAKNLNELATQLQNNPQMINQLDPHSIQVIQKLFLHAAHGNSPNLTPEMIKLHSMVFTVPQEQHSNDRVQQKKQFQENNEKLAAEERAKRTKEEYDRKLEMAAKHRIEERQRLGAQKAGEQQHKQEDNRTRVEQLLSMMPPEARSLYKDYVFGPSLIRESHGFINGVAQSPAEQLRRPTSTASSSSNPPRTPLQSVNRKNNECQNVEEVEVQRWFYKHFPMVWTGRLTLKSTEAMINLHLINGSETFLNDVLGRQLTEENPRRDTVKIFQRLRLDNGQVEHIYRILTNPEYACCLALSSVKNIENLKENDSNLKSSFIDYLVNKKIAGISCLDEVEAKFKSARVHVFAPGEIVNRYLSELASSLHDYLLNTDTRYLLFVFTNDKLDPNMTETPPLSSLAVPPAHTG